MDTDQFHRGPFQLLDAQWRRNVWRRWLRSALLGESTPAPAAAPDGAPSAPQRSDNGSEPADRSSAAASAASSSPTASATIPPPAPEGSSGSGHAFVAPSPRELEARRGEVRARFDAIASRLLAMHESLDALDKHVALGASQDRTHEHRVLDRIEAVSGALARHALALEAVASSVERIEQRVERMERGRRSLGSLREPTEIRDSHVAATRPETDDIAGIEEAFGFDTGRARRSAPPAEAMDSWQPAGSGALTTIRGNLGEMSLSTVLTMLELERRTGVLEVCSEDGSGVTTTLRNGTIVGARCQDLDADPVDAVRTALRFTQGEFWFRQTGVEVASGPPRSVGSVLLEATSRDDEARRTGS
ncbi:MAG: DUF4388 domain-containing protein [Polyangiaceae bacterium]|nr:DUF4388 domain-containing protein [Polyangiaceae bacterium]